MGKKAGQSWGAGCEPHQHLLDLLQYCNSYLHVYVHVYVVPIVRTIVAKLAQARRRAALRAVVWSLVRQQGYMLARIEGELNAPDRAVEGLVGEFGDDGSGVGSSSFLPLDDDLIAT